MGAHALRSVCPRNVVIQASFLALASSASSILMMTRELSLIRTASMIHGRYARISYMAAVSGVSYTEKSRVFV